MVAKACVRGNLAMFYGSNPSHTETDFKVVCDPIIIIGFIETFRQRTDYQKKILLIDFCCQPVIAVI